MDEYLRLLMLASLSIRSSKLVWEVSRFSFCGTANVSTPPVDSSIPDYNNRLLHIAALLNVGHDLYNKSEHCEPEISLSQLLDVLEYP